MALIESAAQFLLVLLGVGAAWTAWYALFDRDDAPLSIIRLIIGAFAVLLAFFVAFHIWDKLPSETEECWWEDRTYICR